MSIRDWYESLFNPRPHAPKPAPEPTGYDCPDCGLVLDFPGGAYYCDAYNLERWIHDHKNGFHRRNWVRKTHTAHPLPGPDQTIEEVGAMEVRAAFGHDHFYEERRTATDLEERRDTRGNLVSVSPAYEIQYTEGVPGAKEDA